MTKTSFTNRLAGLATLALAALPIAALSTTAHAASAVQVKDLNLLTPQGNAVLQQRMKAATIKYCATRKVITDRQACHAGVTAELTQKAAAVRQSQLAALTMSFAVR